MSRRREDKNKNLTLAKAAGSSREAVETAIEKSKQGQSGSWERPIYTHPIPKWGRPEKSRPSAPAIEKRD